MPTRAHTWLMRALLAALLLFASQVLFWNDPTRHQPLDWLMMAAGSLIGASVLLDVIVRARVYDIWGVMVATGLYAVLYAALIDPAASFATVPDSLISRVLGAQWLLALEVFGLFVVMLHREKRIWHVDMLLLGTVAGFFWGVHVTGLQQTSPDAYAAVSLQAALLIAAIVALPPIALYALTFRVNVTAPDLLLSRREWGVLFLLSLPLLGYHAANGAYSSAGLLVSGAIAGVCGVILWYREDEHEHIMPLFDRLLPPARLNPLWLIVTAALFVGAALIGANLPPVNVAGFTPFSLLSLVFSLTGIVWLPFVAAVIGVRAVQDQFMTGEIT